MLTSPQWVPIDDSFDEELLAQLVKEGRRFIKTMAYNQGRSGDRCSAVLTDCIERPAALWICNATGSKGDSAPNIAEQTALGKWSWSIEHEVMPRLPAAAPSTTRPWQPPARGFAYGWKQRAQQALLTPLTPTGRTDAE